VASLSGEPSPFSIAVRLQPTYKGQRQNVPLMKTLQKFAIFMASTLFVAIIAASATNVAVVDRPDDVSDKQFDQSQEQKAKQKLQDDNGNRDGNSNAAQAMDNKIERLCDFC
jgi:hypothetical protein